MKESNSLCLLKELSDAIVFRKITRIFGSSGENCRHKEYLKVGGFSDFCVGRSGFSKIVLLRKFAEFLDRDN